VSALCPINKEISIYIPTKSMGTKIKMGKK